MKTKSIFISTIAMVVLLVVALATGTFAWYTSQNTATGESASLSTAASTSATIALSWSQSGTGSQVTFGSTEVSPMIPTTALATYDTGAAGVAPLFETGVLGVNGGGQEYFRTVTGATAWRQVDSTHTSHILYLRNLNPNADATITTSVTLPTTLNEGATIVDNNDILRVAIYSVVGTATVHTLIGVWGVSSAGNAYYGDLTAYPGTGDDTAYRVQTFMASASSLTLTGNGASAVTFVLPASTNAVIEIYAWLEGTVLDNDRSSLSTTGSEVPFDVAFSAAEITP